LIDAVGEGNASNRRSEDSEKKWPEDRALRDSSGTMQGRIQDTWLGGAEEEGSASPPEIFFNFSLEMVCFGALLMVVLSVPFSRKYVEFPPEVVFWWAWKM
jgi:hypothetical protein